MRSKMKLLASLAVAFTLLSQGACTSSTSSSTEAVKAPSELSVEPLDGGAHLTWHDNSDNEAEFMIERKMTGEDWKNAGMVPFNTTSFHDPNLMAGATYMYRVMAMPKSGEHGSYSNEATCMGPGGSGAAGGSPHDAHHGGAAGGV
jgi:hypothetical protein